MIDQKKRPRKKTRTKYTPFLSFRIKIYWGKPAKNRTTRIKKSSDVFNTMRHEAGRLDKEHFWVVCLTVKNRVIGLNLVTAGTLTSSIVHPRECFKPALLVGAASVILVHNHPSNDPMPSDEDREITRRLVKSGELLGIQVLDHVVMAETAITRFWIRTNLVRPEKYA